MTAVGPTGPHTVRIEVIDNASNLNFTTVNAYNVGDDTQAPIITIDSLTLNGPSPYICFQVSDDRALGLTEIDWGDGSSDQFNLAYWGNPAYVCSGHYYNSLGTKQITIRSFDAAQNQTTLQTPQFPVLADSNYYTTVDIFTGAITINAPRNDTVVFPAGTTFSDSFAIDTTPADEGSSIQITGATLPAGHTKTVTLQLSNPNTKFLCISDGPDSADVQQIARGSCATEGFQLKMACPGGRNATLSDGPRTF